LPDGSGGFDASLTREILEQYRLETRSLNGKL
jgi:hypothetical protein